MMKAAVVVVAAALYMVHMFESVFEYENVENMANFSGWDGI